MTETHIEPPKDRALQLNNTVNTFENLLPVDTPVDDVVTAAEWYALRVAQVTALVTGSLETAGVTDSAVLDIVAAGIEKATNEGFRIGRRVDNNLPEITIRKGLTFSDSDPQPRSVPDIIHDLGK
jgi:hypothetical protein